MKCPLTDEEISSFLSSLDEEGKEKEFLTKKMERYDRIYRGTITSDEIFSGSFYDLLYSMWQFKNADFAGAETFSNFNDNFYNQIFDSATQYVVITIGKFTIKMKKPFSLKDIANYRQIVADENVSSDDLSSIKKALGGNLFIFMNDNEIKNIDSFGYEELSWSFFFAPIIYNIIILYVNSLGSFAKKKIQ